MSWDTVFFSRDSQSHIVLVTALMITDDDNDDTISAAVTRAPLELPAVHTYSAADRISVIR